MDVSPMDVSTAHDKDSRRSNVPARPEKRPFSNQTACFLFRPTPESRVPDPGSRVPDPTV